MLLGRNKYEGIDPVNRSYDEMVKAKEAAERERQESAVVSEEMNSILRKLDKIERIIRKDKAAKERNTVAGAFLGMLAALAKDQREDPAEQHVTTATELTADIRILRERYTEPDGLDAKRYCSALNSWRDNILFTAGELKKAVEDACRSGDVAAVPGYKALINQCQTNAGLLAKEIESVGGTVNK